MTTTITADAVTTGGLRLDNVSRSFGGLKAVADVTMSVPPGKVTGLIGPNGAGKSTIVNLISGYAKITAGRVYVGQTDVSTMDPAAVARLGVARTFQTVRLFSEMTVEENIAVGLKLQRGKAERAGDIAAASAQPAAGGRTGLRGRWLQRRQAVSGVLDRLLETYELTGVRHQMATTLPYGAQRRLEIARAVSRDPKVLLLDEPAAGMTDTEADELGERIKAIARSGVAVLLIEHNTRLVGDVCDFVYVLSQGQMLASGKPADAMADPQVVKAYLGESIE
jgi:branched-chain amino acid transport system ATP-binding protein